jgi:hypothetical protein
MKRKIFTLWIFVSVFAFTRAQQVLIYHDIVRDSSGNLLPWYSHDPATTYDHDLGLIWNLWKNFPADTNGLKHYMTDHSYCASGCGNMIGGDQFAMALSSWGLLYAYTGDTSVISNMVYIANTYLGHSLTPGSYWYPNVPYSANFTRRDTAIYDGDYLLGAGVIQPDKAGSFGYELLNLFKITKDTAYLTAAINIANSLALNLQTGDANNSPFPFKVNAIDGTPPTGLSGTYTSNFAPTMRLFECLIAMHKGTINNYSGAYSGLKNWVKAYPQQNNNWGCFFEDIQLSSNTEINAVTMAWYIMDHPDWSSTYLQDARAILDWTFTTFASHAYDTLGVSAIYEQSVDLKEGGSHTSRYASAELYYSELTGDTSKITRAIRELNWATYLCDTSGQVRFSPAETTVWLTDGYGDYVRHFLRAMAAYPAIAPAYANHLLGSTSVITNINYQPLEIRYNVYDTISTETLRLTSAPMQVKVEGVPTNPVSSLASQGWQFTPLPGGGGSLKVTHIGGNNIDIILYPTAVNDISQNTMKLEVYPNPASGSVNISYTVASAQSVKIEVSDMTGQKVKEINTTAHISENFEKINISDLRSGIYTVRLTTQDGSEMVRKLVLTN